MNTRSLKPVVVVVGFNLLTLFVFLTAPVTWVTDHLADLVFLVLCCQLTIFLGYELGQRSVELVVAERKLLGGREPHVDAGMALLRRCHERLGGVDGSDVVRPEPVHELRRQRPGPTADVDRPLPRLDPGEIGQLRGERHRVAAHEPVVGVGSDGEGHERDSLRSGHLGQTSAVPGRGGVVSQLWRYPVKSFLGERLDEVSLDARGVVGDRAFAVHDAHGKFGSGKTSARFRLLRDLFDFSAETDGAGVVVRAPGGASFRVGDPELDALLSARYGERLAVVAEGAVSHLDAGPVHLLTTSTLRWVEQEYGRTGGDARRYRPNIVLETEGVALVEEEWAGASLSIGSCVLEVSRRVERCVMPTFRQDGLPRSPGS